MRHTTALAAATILVFFLIIGCGGNGDASEQSKEQSQTQQKAEQQTAQKQEQAQQKPVFFADTTHYVTKGDTTYSSSGLKWVDITEGTGASPVFGNRITAHYTLWFEDGTRYQSSKDKNQPYTFTYGPTGVIAGWVEALGKMKKGGVRKLVVPSQLAYGERGRPGIAPGATLIFEIELLDVQ